MGSAIDEVLALRTASDPDTTLRQTKSCRYSWTRFKNGWRCASPTCRC